MKRLLQQEEIPMIWGYLECIEQYDWFEEQIINKHPIDHWDEGQHERYLGNLGTRKTITLTPYWNVNGEIYQGPVFYFREGKNIFPDDTIPDKLKEELVKVMPFKNTI